MYIPGENGDYEKQYTILRNAKLDCKIKNNTFATINIWWLRNKVPLISTEFKHYFVPCFYHILGGKCTVFSPNSSTGIYEAPEQFWSLKINRCICNIYNYVFVNTNSLVVYSM